MKRLVLFLCLAITLSCVEKKPSLQVLQGNAFGTTYTIQYYDTADTEKKELVEKKLDSVIYAVNKSVSTYMPSSDISKINRGDSTVVVDAIFKEVMRISETVYTNSKGYFDPTVGVLRNAYGFGDVAPIEQLSKEKLDSLRTLVGFDKVKILSDGRLRKANKNIYLDFNAIAKGYGIDRIGVAFQNARVSDYLIELGGEVLAKGKNIDKNSYWTAGVESTNSKIEYRKAAAVIYLINSGMAGSGNYRKYRIDTLTNKKYVHTINPITGLAEQNNVTSATVIAPTCALADAYATTFMVLGIEKSKILVNEMEEIDCYLTFINTEGNEEVYISEGFAKVVLN